MAVEKKTGHPRVPRLFFQRWSLLFAARWDDDGVRPNRHDHEIIATVALPAGLIVLGANRALFAIADEVEPALINSTLDEVTLRGGGTTLTEGQVVLIRATLVGISFDPDTHSRVGCEPRDLAIQGRGRIGADVGLVEVEVDRSGDCCRVYDC